MTAPGLYGGPVLVASVLSLKGGVGKTTVTLGLASAAVHRGVDTLLVDLDPQMNATTTVDPESAGGSNGQAGGRRWTVAEVLDDPSRKVIDKAIRVSAWGESLRLLPGSERTENHNHPDPGSKTLFRLANALAKVSPLPELVLVDCPPSLGQLTRSALTAADRAVLVTEPSLFAVTGVQRALEAVQTERLAHRPALQPLGVVINRFRPRVTEHEYRLAELRDLFGPLVLAPVLPDRSAVQQAQGAGVPIHQWPTAGAREVAQSFDALLDRLMRSTRQKVRR
jgi:cellulose biosynthesis protein BcsQ